MKTITDASEIILPEHFRCPICDSAIFVEEVEEWIEEETGSWKAETVKIDCVTFPGYDDVHAFHEYMRSHWSMPYVDWLPLEKAVTEWVNQHYVWDLR